MTDQDRTERRSDWLTTKAMAALCGVSDATVKRRAADGKPIRCPDGTLVEIQSERIQRPQGWEWRVRAMTAPPALSTTHIRSHQGEGIPLKSDAHSDQRALDILETLLVANGATFERQAEKITQLTGEVWESRALARVAEAKLEATSDALASAQQALSVAQAERDEAREQASRLTTNVVDLTEERDLLTAERDALQAQLDDSALAERERKAQRAWWKWWGR